MAQLTIQAPANAGGTFFQDTGSYPNVTFSCPLTSTDAVAVNIFLPDGLAPVPAPDVTGAITGLTAAVPSRVYVGGPTYVLVRTNPATVIGIYADFGSRRV
jgi:hypothetical protein